MVLTLSWKKGVTIRRFLLWPFLDLYGLSFIKKSFEIVHHISRFPFHSLVCLRDYRRGETGYYGQLW